MRRVLVLSLLLALATACSGGPAGPSTGVTATVAGDDTSRGVEHDPYPRAPGSRALHLGESYTWPSGDTIVISDPLPVGSAGSRMVKLNIEVTNGGPAAETAASYVVRARADNVGLKPVRVPGLVAAGGDIPSRSTLWWSTAYQLPPGPVTFEVQVVGSAPAAKRPMVTFSGKI